MVPILGLATRVLRLLPARLILLESVPATITSPQVRHAAMSPCKARRLIGPLIGPTVVA